MSETIKLSAPRNWEELTKEQLLYACRLFLYGYPEDEFLYRMFLQFAKLKSLRPRIDKGKLYFKHKKKVFTLEPYQVHEFAYTLSFLKDEPTLSKNLFPYFRILFRKYYGPLNKCYNLTFNEYIHASKCVYAFSKTADFKYINQLCAILYRPSGKGSSPGDKRRAFNDFVYPKVANRFHLLSKRKRLAVLFFFQGSQYHMRKAFTNLFSGSSVSSEPSNPVAHLQDAVQVLNMGDITKNNQIYNTLVWQVFKQLDFQLAELKNKKNAKI